MSRLRHAIIGTRGATMAAHPREAERTFFWFFFSKKRTAFFFYLWRRVMSHTVDRLTYMANQIARNFNRRPPAEAATETAAHIKSFWEKRMLGQIFAHLDAGGEGLDDVARAALQSLR